MWPPIRRASGWARRAANTLGLEKSAATAVRGELAGLLGARKRHRQSVGKLGEAVDHFVRVSRSYRPGLFACYGAAGLPRANNALEQAFGERLAARAPARRWCCAAAHGRSRDGRPAAAR